MGGPSFLIKYENFTRKALGGSFSLQETGTSAQLFAQTH